MNKINSENEVAVTEVLNDVFDNFDFDRVKKTMDALDWTWSHIGEENAAQARRVPTVDEIKQFAANLMWECASIETERIASGGFVVEKDFNDPEDPWMRLAFEVTDWEGAVDNDKCFDDDFEYSDDEI